MMRIAHRGASKYEVENSMAAFKKAVELGVDYIEADVQITRDDVPVIRHDRLLDRTTNLSGYINEFTFREIREKARLANGEPVPSLEELCHFVARQEVKLYVDIKAFGKELIVLHTILSILPEEKFIIGAFHSEVILNIKQANPKVTTVLILEGNPINLEKEAIDCHCDIIAFGFDAIDENMIKRAQKIPKIVFTWTVDDPREIQKAKEMGVEGITSNCPDLI